MKYLIVGLGNPGDEYLNTRHNVGYMVLDAFAKASNTVFQDKRYGFVGRMQIKNRKLVLLKPTTYMNLSGNSVRYWLNKEKIEIERLLIVTDDLALPIGTIRLKGKGGDGGHNGLRNIIQTLSTQNFARLRVGIGNNFNIGAQVKFVLDEFSTNEIDLINKLITVATDVIKSFCLSGLTDTMTIYNKRDRNYYGDQD
ncbi:MAG TPA: aminoacyl-tRNA hydrolase [Bacteroidaceae bacterium]|nr:aminoacyl-tRNA hydrolase [Bacteroidaceae bacterium]